MIAGNFESWDELNCDWLAMRYVGDEMSVAERAQFEGFLADNQEAREAVAAAVLMFTAVPLAVGDSIVGQKESRPAPVELPRRRISLRRVGWSLAGAAACVAGLFGVIAARHWPVASPRATSADGKDLGTQATSDLALQWTFLAGRADALAADSIPDAGGAADGNSDEPASTGATSITASTEPADDLAAPSWLLAAVSLTSIAGPPARGKPATD